MQGTTKTGKTIEDAISNGLEVLGAERDEVEVEPLETGRSGFLGLFGRRDAKVRISVRPDDKVSARVLIRNIIKRLGLALEPVVEEENSSLVVKLGEEASMLIGHHGQTLDALQYLASRIINSERDKWKKVIIDIDNYRDRREDNLHSLAQRLADQALKEGRDQRTDPLSAQDRRIIHMTLRDHPKVTTFSVGDGAYRRVIVSLREGVPERRDRSRSQRNRGGRPRGGSRDGGNGGGTGSRTRSRRSRGGARRGGSGRRNKESIGKDRSGDGGQSSNGNNS